MARVSVVEAANALGVHPQRIHQRIRDGSIPAERVGHQWSIDEADLALVRHRRGPGRPLSAKSAWALAAVAAADEEALARLSPSERSRARSRLHALLNVASADDLDEAASILASALRNRADRELFIASARDLPDLRDDSRLHLSGVSLPESNISSGDIVEGYVAAKDLGGLVADYLLSHADRRRANVILHVSEPDAENLVFDHAPESLLVRAADLAEHDGVREKNEAVKSVAELHAWFVANGAEVIGTASD